MADATIETSSNKGAQRSKLLSRCSLPATEKKPCTHTVCCEGMSASFVVSLSPERRHTLEWEQPLVAQVDGVTVTVPPGKLGMYYFPTMTPTETEGQAPPNLKLKGGMLELMRRVILSLDFDTLAETDLDGATSSLALIVANNEDSVALSMSLFRAHPRLMSIPHTKGAYEGETALHALAANEREAELRTCMQLAIDNLGEDEVRTFFSQQTKGDFFWRPPMIFFGGTVFGYACAFNLTDALLKMAQPNFPVFNPNERDQPENACQLTGFRAVHVAVANEDTFMFDFLIGDAADERGNKLPLASQFARDTPTQLGSRPGFASGLTSLQLAAQLGSRKMFEHILRRHVQMNWVWGPVAEYRIDLLGIDSAGQGGGDVMELIGNLNAKPETKEMLLDDFMSGFIFNLFMEKYASFARYVHFAHCCLGGIYLMSIIVLSFDKDTWADPSISWIVILLISMTIIIEEEVRESVLWWWNQRSSGDLMYRLYNLGHELIARGMPMKITGWTTSLLSAILLVTERGHPTWEDETAWLPTVVSATLCISLLTGALVLIRDVLISFGNLGIFVKIVNKMLFRDIRTWMVLFGLYMVVFALALNLVMPKTQIHDASASTMSTGERFMSLILMIYLLVTTGDGGELLRGIYDLNNTWSFANFMALGIYLLLIVFLIILLLNLLIATMGNTYVETLENATLEWRTEIARLVLRRELICGRTVDTRAGVKEGDSYYYKFRQVSGGKRGDGTQDIFSSISNNELLETQMQPGASRRESMADPSSSYSKSAVAQSFKRAAHLSQSFHIRGIKYGRTNPMTNSLSLSKRGSMDLIRMSTPI